MPALYVVRHGEPALKGVLLGRLDPPLSYLGRRQMEAVHIGAVVWYTSPLLRARESAAIAAHGAQVIVLSEFAELSLGEWDGKRWEEIEKSYPELAARKLADWTGVTPPGGEPWGEFASRIQRGLEVVRNGPAPAAISGHIAVNACIAALLRGVDPVTFRQEYGQVYEYEL